MKSTELTIHTGRRRGTFDITRECAEFVAGEGDGLLNVFVPHATCGLVIMELGSGSESDLQEALDRLLPRDDRYTHRHGTQDTARTTSSPRSHRPRSPFPSSVV